MAIYKIISLFFFVPFAIILLSRIIAIAKASNNNKSHIGAWGFFELFLYSAVITNFVVAMTGWR